MIPLLVVAALLAPALAPVEPVEGAPAPEGCSKDAPKVYTCAWDVVVEPTSTLTDAERRGAVLLPIPRVGPSLVDVRITAPNSGYQWGFRNVTSGAEWWPAPIPGYIRAAEGETLRWVVYVVFAPDHAAEFQMIGFAEPFERTAAFPQTYRIEIRFEETSGTRPAGGSAGSPLDPQLLDGSEDATTSAPASADLLGGWFDDPVLDDALVEAGLRVADLRNLSQSSNRHRWVLEWSLLGERYRLEWKFILPTEAGTPRSDWTSGAVERTRFWYGGLSRVTDATEELLYFDPVVDVEAGTMRAPVPLRLLANPDPEARFENLEARAYVGRADYPLGVVGRRADDAVGNADLADSADDARRAFALGGPTVWAQLRGEPAGLVSASIPAPWYSDPLAPENLADTLQVAGAAAAAVTFVAGLLVVRRRREKLARLLDDVDAVLGVHADDPAAALTALDKLQERFDGMLRAAKLDEAQHAALTARIERAGFRLLRPKEVAR